MFEVSAGGASVSSSPGSFLVRALHRRLLLRILLRLSILLRLLRIRRLLGYGQVLGGHSDIYQRAATG